MTDPTRPPSRARKLAPAAILAAGMLLAGGAVLAHGDYDWIRTDHFRNPVTGEHCCGENDCVVLPAADVEPTQDGWRILSTGERIPERETLRSKDGRFWRCHMPNGRRRCFFVPPGVS